MQEDLNGAPNPSGLCMCGCGGITSRATQDDPKNGILKGQHRRYLKSHHLRGVPRKPETIRKMSAAHKGKRTGPENARWRGGLQMRRGRLNRFVGKDHPMAQASGYVLEYRLVMARKLGRPLAQSEHVHHIDLDPSNNSEDNLVVLTASQHLRVHSLIRKGMDSLAALKHVLENHSA